MKRALTVVLFAVLLAAPPSQARVRCDLGVPMFAHGTLRVFGVSADSDEWTGHDFYACRGAATRPAAVGGVGLSTGTASAAVPRFVYDGGRYLAREDYSDGEGGPDSFYVVTDMRTRRTVNFVTTPAHEPENDLQFRLTTRGDVLCAGDGDVRLVPRGTDGSRSAGRVLFTSDTADAHDVALVGTTAYWTVRPETGTPSAGSATVANSGGAGEPRVFEPVRVRRDRGRCARRRGTTVERSSLVRVFRRGGRRYACRRGSAALVRLPAGAVRDVRITSDRWLLSVGAADAVLVDMSDGRTRPIASVRAWTLLANGTVAWIAANGALYRERAGATAATQLAPAADAASALASSGSSIYWTAGGVAHRADG
jgi:hypothetical protein